MLQLTDGVVALSNFIAGDASVLRDVDFDPEHRRRFDFPDAFRPSLQHSEAVIARWEQERLAGTRFAFAVRETTTGTLLGSCELRPLVSGTANLSYWTHPAYRRHGFASRAVGLACKIAFVDLGFVRLEVLTDPDNVGSREVAARNGFKEVGTRDGRILYTVDAI